jgi:putative FmdB family regulatory protein
MPVYEFVCRDCQKGFEVVRPVADLEAGTVTCAHCGSRNIERAWSRVYAITSKKS